jgi:hypothetical protein
MFLICELMHLLGGRIDNGFQQSSAKTFPKQSKSSGSMKSDAALDALADSGDYQLVPAVSDETLGQLS